MSANDVMLGAGLATGMFYTAPENTSLPTYPGASLSSWTKVGDVTEEGITWSPKRDFTPLKNWAGKIKRQLPGTDPQTIKVPIMDTTKDVFETIFGSDKVTAAAATSAHGNLLTIDTSNLDAPGGAAFLFIMKDGDRLSMFGTTSGFISGLDDVSFKPNEAVTWTATISTDAWVFVTDDGEIES